MAEVRREELEPVLCARSGSTHLEMLGYRDSGMAGWDGNQRPGRLLQRAGRARRPARVAGLIERYQPQVVVTYDENGGYGHPDHIQTHRVAMAALDGTTAPAKVYFTARSQASAERMLELRERLQLAAGRGGRPGPAGGYPGCRDHHDHRYPRRPRAQAGRPARPMPASWPTPSGSRSDEAEFAELFGAETFMRVRDSTGAALPEVDLFAGL